MNLRYVLLLLQINVHELKIISTDVAIGPVTQWHVKGAVTLLWEVSTVMVALWVHNVHHPNSHSINCVRMDHTLKWRILRAV